MNTDLRRAKRYHDFIPVYVSARNGINGVLLAGPFAGRIINISRYGACLLLSLGLLDSYTVYSVTVRNAASFLEVQGTMPRVNRPYKLPARPVWTDPCILNDVRAYRMGVEFLVHPEGEQMNDIMEYLLTTLEAEY